MSNESEPLYQYGDYTVETIDENGIYLKAVAPPTCFPFGAPQQSLDQGAQLHPNVK